MTAITDPLLVLSAAHIPINGMPMLGAVRHQPDVTVQLDGVGAWVRWPAGRLDVVRCLIPITGAVFYRRTGNDWYRFRSRLPASEGPPEADGIPVASVLFPDRIDPLPPPASKLPTVTLTIVRGGAIRPATALLASILELGTLIDTATTRELGAMQGAIDGDRVILLGRNLPPVRNAVRFWGDDLLVPLGFRVEPFLPDEIIRAVAGAGNDDRIVFHESGLEIVPRSAFQPLTRPMLRLALEHRTPVAS